MRKITSFTIAAIALGVAIIFCARSSVVATSPDMLRPQAGDAIWRRCRFFLPYELRSADRTSLSSTAGGSGISRRRDALSSMPRIPGHGFGRRPS